MSWLQIEVENLNGFFEMEQEAQEEPHLDPERPFLNEDGVVVPDRCGALLVPEVIKDKVVIG